MIKQVQFEKSTYADLPYKFEAGTPNICGGIAFGAAIDYIHSLGIEAIAAHEHQLLAYAIEKLQTIEGIILYGNPDLTQRTAVDIFQLAGRTPLRCRGDSRPIRDSSAHRSPLCATYYGFLSNPRYSASEFCGLQHF